MTRLNRKVEYALMALRVMAAKRPGEKTSAKEISEHINCPFDATARVLQLLGQRGILRSEQGAHGGYILIRDLSRLSLLELMEIVVGPMAVAKCLHEAGDCELKSTCNIISPITLLNRRLGEFYQNLMVGDLLRLREKSSELVEATL